MRRIPIILMVLATAGFLMLPVEGRVFQGRNLPQGMLNTAGLPWQPAYRSRMDVDGQAMDLHVWSARFNEPVIEQLRHQFEQQGARVELDRSADGAQGLARFEDRDVRIMVLSPESQPNQLVFLFYPLDNQPTDTQAPVPPYPGALKSKTVRSGKTESVCFSFSTADPPEQVVSFYARYLRSDGWRSALPDAASGSMVMFQKGQQICCVLAKRGNNAYSHATVLVKGGGL